jgi:hypothetical protein
MMTDDATLAENARVAYAVAGHLWAAEHARCWATFNAFLVGQCILLAALGVSVAVGPPGLLPRLMAAGGIVLSGFWFVLTRGGAGPNGAVVKLRVPGIEHELQQPPGSRARPTEWAAYSVIGLFAGLDLALVLLAWR